MNNTALLHNVGDRAVQATSLAEHTLREVVELVADTAADVSGRVHDAGSALPGRHRRSHKSRMGRIIVVAAVVGVVVVAVKLAALRAAELGRYGQDDIRPYPTSDPAYDQKAVDDAAERMGSTGHGGAFDPDPTNSHDPEALEEAARRMGAER